LLHERFSLRWGATGTEKEGDIGLMVFRLEIHESLYVGVAEDSFQKGYGRTRISRRFRRK